MPNYKFDNGEQAIFDDPDTGLPERVEIVYTFDPDVYPFPPDKGGPSYIGKEPLGGIFYLVKTVDHSIYGSGEMSPLGEADLRKLDPDETVR